MPHRACLQLAIFGGPISGKSTTAGQFGVVVKGTDGLRKLPWSDASHEVAKWFNAPGDWAVEGVVVGRALRKWLADNPEGRPVDMVVFLNKAQVSLNPDQERMRKGCETVFQEIEGELRRRGVHIQTAF